MRLANKLLICAASAALSGCIYYVQPAQQATQPQSDYVAPPPPQPAPQPVVYQPPPPEVAPVYQDELSPYGRWFVHPRYGRCWIPYGVPYGWQPYTIGHWVYTSDGSCCWVSEDREVEWGGIVYHYGQWVFTPDSGWVWVPGTVWAPAWVAWREGDGYCGWTPLPPEACQGPVTVVVIDQYCPPQRYVYCDEHYFTGGRIDQHIVRNDVTIINRTTNITNVTIVNNTIINRGVPAEHVERATGRTVERVSITNAGTPDDARRLAREGAPVRFSTPAIETVHAKVVEQNNQRQQELEQQRAAHDAQLQQQKQQHEQEVQQAQQAERDKQAAHQQDVHAAQDAERQKAAEHAQQVEQQRQAARDAEQQRQQQIAAEKQAAHDRAVQAARDAADARQAERDRAAAADNNPGPGKPPVKGKPKPGQPGQQGQPPQ